MSIFLPNKWHDFIVPIGSCSQTHIVDKGWVKAWLSCCCTFYIYCIGKIFTSNCVFVLQLFNFTSSSLVAPIFLVYVPPFLLNMVILRHQHRHWTFTFIVFWLSEIIFGLNRYLDSKLKLIRHEVSWAIPFIDYFIYPLWISGHPRIGLSPWSNFYDWENLS